MVKSVPKSFENVYLHSLFSYKERHKKHFAPFTSYYLFTDKVKIALNSSSLFGNVLSSISLIVIFTNFKFVASSELKKALMFFSNNSKVSAVKVLS